MKSTIIGIVLSLIIGGGVGYASGKGANNNGDQTQKLQDSIAMMKEQSSDIQKMADLMKSGGTMMQEMGMKYKDDSTVSRGKDLEMMGVKYLEENIKATEEDASMKQNMN